LTLNATTGVIAGTPTANGGSTFGVQLADAHGVITTKQLTINVGAQILITPTPLSSGEVGVAYSQTLAATGGTAPLVWSIASGVLPAGLALNAATGVISGTPTASILAVFIAQVQDATGAVATAPFSITVGAPLAIATSSLPDGALIVAYAQPIIATGGVSPYLWSISSGALPGGVALVPAIGLLLGSPTANGVFTFTVQVQDGAGVIATKQLTIRIGQSLAIANASLPDGSVGVPYSQTLTGTGGAAPYVWSILPSALPAGLTLDTNRNGN